SLADIQECIKELNKLINNSSNGDSSTLLNRCIKSLEAFDDNAHRILSTLRKTRENNIEPDANIILKSMQSLQITAGKKEKSELEIKQEWDMKKLYAELFKISYKRNRLKTDIEQEELKPKKKGDDQPNLGNAIWWYTCDKANIYYQINSILRLENFELLMSYRYFLSDLCRMIEYLYQRRKDEFGDVAQTFYRAGHINKSQLQKMDNQQKGQLISLVGFISATTDIEIAKGYARKQHISDDNQSVLFEIVIKPQEACTAFAYIEDISFHPEEKEVLFSMSSTFTVGMVREPENNESFYRVQLIGADIDKTIIDDIRTKIEKNTPSGRAALLAQYLMELGEYRAARKYLNSLLAQGDEEGILFNDPSLASIYSCLGMTYTRQGLFGDAIKSFKQALNTQARLEYSNNNVVANIHRQIGLAYVGLGHVDEAEETLSEAVRIQIRELNSNQQHLAAIYSNIGHVHYKKGNLDKAQSTFNEAEKIYKKRSSKIAHDELEQSLIQAEHLTNYGHFLFINKSSADAQEKYNEALKLYKKIVPDSDPKLMQTHINIMLAYATNKKYNEAITWFNQPMIGKLIKKQEINMFELNSSVTQLSLAFLHEFIGACYATQKDFDKAIHMWTRALLFKHKARLEELLLETTNSTFSSHIFEQKTFIDSSYQLAYDYYSKQIDEVTESNGTINKPLTRDFCIGLLYAELYNRDQAIACLKRSMLYLSESNDNMLYIAYLLIADILQQQRKYKDAVENLDATLQLIASLKEKDRVLEIEIELARSDCLIEINSRDIIPCLLKLANSLNANDSDTKRISLQAIVYDTLAKCCLKQGNHELFDTAAEESMALKLRNFSQYHPSLAITLVLIAERLIQLSQYRQALDFYEHALEIQNLNLADNHPKIRKICYAIGDIYCKLDKLSIAIEKYDVAESKSLECNDDIALRQEKINSKESMDIFMARVRMHQNLTDYYAKKKNYKDSITEMYKIHDLLKAKLPLSAFNYNDETLLIQNNINPTTLINNLQQLINCYLNRNISIDFEQDDENASQIALEICQKLSRHDKEVTKGQLVLLYRQLSLYYEDLDDNENALDYLQKTINIEQPAISTLYRLAYLNTECDEFDEAISNYEKILNNELTKGQREISQIIQEKLSKVREKAKKTERRSSTISSSSDESGSDEEASHHSASSSRLNRDSTSISRSSRAENGSENKIKTKMDSTEYGLLDDTCDYRTIAAAYLQLGDNDMCIECHEKYTKKCKKDISTNCMFSKHQQIITEQACHYEEDDTITLLARLFHDLNEKFRETGSFEKSEVLNIADSFFQCGLLYKQKSFYLESTNAYISAFSLYMSKSLTNSNELIDNVNQLLGVFVENNLACEQIVDVCKRYLTSTVTERMRISLAALYRENEIYNVEDLDGDDDTSNESRNIALQHYKDLLENTDNIMTKGACYFNILNLYKNHIYEDDDGKCIIEKMMLILPKFTISDRILLIKLAVHFMAEYDNNKGTCDMKINRQLQKMEKEYSNEKLEIHKDKCIGKYLVDCDDLEGAKEYWDLIGEQIKSSIPHWILSLVRDSDSIFEDILHTIKQPENDTVLLLNQLVSTYESLGDYYMLDAKIGQTTGANCCQQAENMYKNAVHLLKRFNSNSEKVPMIEKKQREATGQTKN
ncbi:unnamed protein product, partial [Adineta ricciae]